MKELLVNRARQAISDRISIYGFGEDTVHMRPLRKRIPTDTPFEEVENNTNSIFQVTPLSSDKDGNFRTADGDYIHLKGINADASMKLPTSPKMASYIGNSNDPNSVYFDGDNVSFVGRPWPLEEAHEHLMRIKSWGYNTIRYLLTWEAVEHKGPGQYDDEFVDYTIKILNIIREIGGLYVILEFHQDVWSRYTGGSGAPMWTIYAAGLDPKNFCPGEGAVLHNDPKWNQPGEVYPKMLWTTNYKRLACLTMFTLFFSGKTYFPDLEINGQNIQDYLQDCYFGALSHIWQAINTQAPELISSGMIIGFESMNEPNSGLVGYPDLSELPENQNLRVGTCPTVFDALKLGMGFAASVDNYRIAITGPQKKGKVVVDPKGVSAWMSPETAARIDKHYGWTRSEEWKMGECIFYQQKIWRWHPDINLDDLASMTPEARLELSESKTIMLKPHYFCRKFPNHHYKPDQEVPEIIDFEFFLVNQFLDFFIRHKKAVRDVCPTAYVLMQNPVLEIPPDIINDPRQIVDDRFVWTPHYYDGLSLMFKTWNTKYNVDTLGIMRERYANPVLGIVFGDRAIRKCLRRQFKEMKEECYKNIGRVPILMSETGMPFDMDEKRAYRTYRYHSQTQALDALSYALEGCQMDHTYWCYCSINCHKWGDRWNNEDFSFWSQDDRNLPLHHTNSTPSSVSSSTKGSRRNSVSLNRLRNSTVASMILERNSTSVSRESKPSSPMSRSFTDDVKFNDYKFSQDIVAFPREEDEIEPMNDLTEEADNLKLNTESEDPDLAVTALDDESMQACAMLPTTSDRVAKKHLSRDYPSVDGVRAVNAVVRPYMVKSPGTPVTTEFDLATVKYLLTIKLDFDDVNLASRPTIIFLPRWHYPFFNSGDIYISGGHIKYHRQLEYLEWYHEREEGEDNCVNEASIMIRNRSGPITEVRHDYSKSYCPVS